MAGFVHIFSKIGLKVYKLSILFLGLLLLRNLHITGNILHFYIKKINQESSDAKASKCHLNFSSRMIIFIKLVVYLSSVISLKWQFVDNLHPHWSEINELKYTSLIKIIILEENFKWHLEAFASELFICSLKSINLGM